MRRRAFPLLVLLAAACVQPTATDPVTGQAYYSPIGNDYASQDAYIRLNHITRGLWPTTEASCRSRS